jgi:hypothetical protein
MNLGQAKKRIAKLEEKIRDLHKLIERIIPYIKEDCPPLGMQVKIEAIAVAKMGDDIRA